LIGQSTQGQCPSGNLPPKSFPGTPPNILHMALNSKSKDLILTFRKLRICAIEQTGRIESYRQSCATLNERQEASEAVELPVKEAAS
jgi:hypothetical protein